MRDRESIRGTSFLSTVFSSSASVSSSSVYTTFPHSFPPVGSFTSRLLFLSITIHTATHQLTKHQSVKMQFSIATIILGFAAIASAGVAGDASIFARQNAGRPVPSGNCCVASTSVKQDTCTATNGQTGKCVPGGAGACM
jgi:hypothetical protein